mgnify:FL=1
MNRPTRRVSSLGLVLGLLYLAFSLFVITRQYEGSWGGFLLFWASFPASLLALVLPDEKAGEIMLAAVGVVWWYAIGHYFQFRRSG